MEDEQDSASLLLDSRWSDCSSLLQTPHDSICRIVDEEYDEIGSFDFNLEAASAAAAQDLGDWIPGSPIPQDADFGRCKWIEWSQWIESELSQWSSEWSRWRSEWSQWSDAHILEDRIKPGKGGPMKRNEEEQRGGSTCRNQLRIPGLLEDHQSFQGSHHDSRHEFQSGSEGACKRRKNICGLFIHVHVTHSEHSARERSNEQAQEEAREVKVCPVIKTGRSSNSCPTLIKNLKLRYDDMEVEEKSAAAQNVGDKAQLNKVSASSMAKIVDNEVSRRSSRIRCSTLGEPISYQNQSEMHNKMPSWQSTFEVLRPGVLNDGESSRNDAQVPNWRDEELSAWLLSKIKRLEGTYRLSTSDQGLWGRTPLGKKIEADIAAKGSTARLSSCPKLFHNGLVDSEMEHTCTDVEDDESQNFASSYSLEYDDTSGTESSATSDPQAESTGDSCRP